MIKQAPMNKMMKDIKNKRRELAKTVPELRAKYRKKKAKKND